MATDTPNSSSGIASRLADAIGDRLAAFLSKPRAGYRTFSTISTAHLQANLKPGDLILVEGNSRVSTAIKYLTQSTWSHVCIYIGEQTGIQPLLEADLVEGVITVPLDKYEGFNLRICRPINLSPEDTHHLIDFLIARLGHQYDNKNIVDLVRYLMPTPPVPQRFRRKLLEFGSGDPTKAICSTLIAQAFQSIRYPILPLQSDAKACYLEDTLEAAGRYTTNPLRNMGKVFARRHYSHYTPRDFDLSPYFSIVKPTINEGFYYKDILWTDH